MHLINPISADMLAIYKLRVNRVFSLNKVEFYSYVGPFIDGQIVQRVVLR